jgi:hypothetical protein
MDPQISEIAGDGLGTLNLEFTKYEVFNGKKVELKVEFEYDNYTHKSTIIQSD